MTLSLIQTEEVAAWKKIVRNNFCRVDAFVNFLQLDSSQQALVDFKPKFPIQVPLRLAQKMDKGNLNDPLVRQFLPLLQEKIIYSDYTADPVCDSAFRTGKLIQKYQGRVLVACTSACAMHCRYCFRQNFDYDTTKSFNEAIQLIQEDSSIHEVILSGGDPLSLPTETLLPLFQQLANISHLKKVRFHTRFPIGIPERIDADFLRALAAINKQIIFVIHCNHPNELDQDIIDALKSLHKIGCLILNQSVLLKGVNDNADTLIKLNLDLVDNGILPYYLHQLDQVQGAHHFKVSEEVGLELIEAMRKALPGYAVPKYVREIAGEPYKTPL